MNDLTEINKLVDVLYSTLDLKSIGKVKKIPSALILSGVPNRQGLSAIKIANRIISRKSEAGLPIGLMQSGNEAPDEIMERIRIEEIINALIQEAVITIGVDAGISITANGASPSGPVTVTGTSVSIGNGYGVIQ